MKRYRAYGLVIACDEALSELDPAATEDADAVVISLRAGDPPPLPQRWRGTILSAAGARLVESADTREACWLRIPGLALIAIAKSTARIQVYPIADTSDAVLRRVLLDTALPLLLTLRGLETFHASAVMVDGRAIGFLAASGTGKSTLAAHFVGRGHTPLCDDCLAIDCRGHPFSAVPAYPGLRLYQDAARVVGLEPSETPGTTGSDQIKRRVVPREAAIPAGPVPIGAFFVLERVVVGPPSTERLSGTQAVVALLRHAFRLDHEEVGTLKRQFDAWVSLLAILPVFRLCVPDGLGSLEAVRRRILGSLLLG